MKKARKRKPAIEPVVEEGTRIPLRQRSRSAERQIKKVVRIVRIEDKNLSYDEFPAYPTLEEAWDAYNKRYGTGKV